MSDLVEFLRARLDEDEALAREAPGNRWLIGNAVDPTKPCSVHTFPEVRLVADGLNWLTAEHIARHNPERVLADVEAKRKILDAYEHWQGRVDGGEDLSQFERGMLADLYAVCRILAEAQGWKP